MEKPVTLIIGLGQTVGEAIAQRFAEGGHAILAVDPSQALLDDLAKTVDVPVATHHGPTHTQLGIRNAMAAALEAYGRIDNVVCTPKLPQADALLDLEMDDFEEAVLESISGAVKALRIFAKEMISNAEEPESAADRNRQSGSFTFVLSLNALLTESGWFTESVTQNALLGVVRSASIELAPHNIRVNAITALRPRAEKRETWLKARTPAGRTALAEEIGEAAFFLASASTAIMTGEALTLDGGRRNLSGLMPEEAD